MLHQSRLKTCSSLFINMRCVAHAVWVPQVEEYHLFEASLAIL